MLSLVKSLVAELRPLQVHFPVVLLNERLNLLYLALVEDACRLKHRRTVLANEELRGPSLGQLPVAGVHVHALHDAVAGEVQKA